MARFSVTLRGVAALATVAALTLAFAASADATPLLWTLNSGKATAATIETGTNQVVGSPIAVGTNPISVAITPDGRKAFVVNMTGDSVSVIETATRSVVKTIPLTADAERIAISPDGKTAYVTVEGDEHVFVIDTETNGITGSFAVAPEASAVAFTPDGKHAYVGSNLEAISVVETAAQKVVGNPISVGGFPTAIAFTPNGGTAYVTVAGVNGVAVIDTALGQVVKNIPTASEPAGIAVSPSGQRLYVSGGSAGNVTVVATTTNEIVGSPITVGGEAEEIAIAPNGRAAYVAGIEQVTPINLITNKAEAPIATTGDGVYHLVVAPDQSPTASFTAPTAVATLPTTFDGSGSIDPDGSIAAWSWAFGDGTGGTGATTTHTYAKSGTYNAELSVVDDEGCGAAEVFTGRTAYCSGNPLAKAVHPVEVKTAPVVCKARFRFGRLIHKRKNGTARLQVKLPAAGSILLFGKKVHAVTRKVKKAGSMWLTIHARVELNKRLKRIHRTRVRIRVTFTPSAGCGYKTLHRSLALLRAHKHHRH
jgi:YVTN family beta-propeller protein